MNYYVHVLLPLQKMAMIKTVERYDKKLPDLKGLIEDYIAGTVKVKIKIRF